MERQPKHYRSVPILFMYFVIAYAIMYLSIGRHIGQSINPIIGHTVVLFLTTASTVVMALPQIWEAMLSKIDNIMTFELLYGFYKFAIVSYVLISLGLVSYYISIGVISLISVGSISVLLYTLIPSAISYSDEIM